MLRVCLLRRELLHALPQAERPHISPHLLYVGKALLFGAALTHIKPTQGIVSIEGPYRVLFLVIYDDFVDRCIFGFVGFDHGRDLLSDRLCIVRRLSALLRCFTKQGFISCTICWRDRSQTYHRQSPTRSPVSLAIDEDA